MKLVQFTLGNINDNYRNSNMPSVTSEFELRTDPVMFAKEQ